MKIEEFTKLPIKEIVRGDSIGSAFHVTTPHKGIVIIDNKERHIPFFGSDSTVEVPVEEIIRKILILEEESREFLFNKWVKQLEGKI